ncbi:MAG: hypothetical protein FRX48_03473 [Lasallia pustulata]|uniref:Uncharacterized protein n=1 Tax=Lasallia pustulata TaxID=136370 RepID=A0A5M8PTY2_9LECA|nr:MAG: hypothetical protein FRX48_03473 [Lasallia pustulata]
MSSSFQDPEYHNPLTRNCGACGAFGDWRHNFEPSVYKKKMLEVRNSAEANPQTSILGPYTCKKCEGKMKAIMRDEARMTRDHNKEAAIEQQVHGNAPTAGEAAHQGAPAFGTHLDAFRGTTKSDHARETERLMEEDDVTWISGGASAAQAAAPNRSNKKRSRD